VTAKYLLSKQYFISTEGFFMPTPVKVGVIGCGNISDQYLSNAPKFPILQVTALADLDIAKAEAQAKKYGIPRVLSVDALLVDPDIELVINLTIPQAHVPVGRQAIAHGKHTYAEKPLGLDRAEARQMLDEAAAKNLRVGCAPDTFMGAGIQTARKVIDDGLIGVPVAATAFMMGRGHESWHPSPEFYYAPGGGPMFDMGPYYLTALLNLLGPIKRLTGSASIAVPERTITSQPKHGQKITVETPDHIAGTLEFAQGTVATIITSFAVHQAQYNGEFPITIYGTEGTLKVPDPNNFDGTVQLWRANGGEWEDVPPAFVMGYGRMVGVADMAYAVRSGRPHRASAEQAYTVLDAMQGFLDTARTGQSYTLSAPYARPAPMPADLPFGTLDE
jgi:predicted dehydrogenase